MISFLSNSTYLRTLFLLGFIVSMGLLAIPIVARQTDHWLYYSSGPSVPELEPLPSFPEAETKSTAPEKPAPAIPVAPSPPRPKPTGNATKPKPKPIAPVGHEAPIEPPLDRAKPPKNTNAPPPRLSDAEIERLEGIRKELVQAGASDIRVEWLAVEQQYVFRCAIPSRGDLDMSTEFAVAHKDAYEAARRVLKQVLTTPVE